MLRKNQTITIIAVILFNFTIVWGWADIKVNQDTDNSVQNEPSITINHHFTGDLLNMIVGYNDIGKSLGISYSPDSGKTWFDTQLPTVYSYATGDPCVGSDNLGNAYACFLSYDGSWFTGKSGIFVCKSTDGGRNWGTSVTVDNPIYTGGAKVPFADKCMMAVDTFSASSYENYIYVAWQRDDTLGYNSDLYFAYSSNLGASFSTPLKINDDPAQTAFCEGAFPFVGADGDVYVTWYNNYFRGHDDGEMYIDKSTNGGTTFGTDVLAANFKAPPLYTYGNTGFKAKTFPSAAADPIDPEKLYITYISDPDGYFDRRIDWGKHPGIPGQTPSAMPVILQDGNNVYVAWEDYRNGMIDIYFNRSTDNGLTWDFPDKGPLDAGVTPGSSTSSAPKLSSSGNYVYCVWGDYRLGTSEVYFNYSSDYGNTWQITDLRIDGGGVGSAVDPTITSDGSYVYVAWADTRSGMDDIYFTHSSNNGLNWTAPTRVDLGDGAGAKSSTMPRLACAGNYVYCAWQDMRNGNTNQIYFNYSSNNGVSWYTSSIQLSQGSGYWCQMPVRDGLKCDNNYVYVCWASGKNSPDNDIFFNNSTNYGATWWGETQISDGGFHAYMPVMTIEGNKVYIAWEDDRHSGAYINDIFFDYSYDNGMTWNVIPDIPISPIPGINSRVVNIAADGKYVYANWYDERLWGFGGGDIFFNKSSDSGATWGTETKLSYGSQPVPLQIPYSVIAAGNNNVTVTWADQRWFGLPNIYANHSSDNGSTWLNGMDEADVYCVRSTNGGASWQSPVKVNDDVGDYAQLLPCVVVKANGMVDISYYSFHKTVIDPMIPGAEVRMAVSTNGGISFNPSILIQDTIVTPSTLWVGEYNGMAVLDTMVYTVFTDFQQTGNSDIFIDRVANPTSSSCCIGMTGNVDGEGGEPGIDIADLVYYVEYSFFDPPGPAPPCPEEADVDGVIGLDIGDIVYMVEYMFFDPPGPEPVLCP